MSQQSKAEQARSRLDQKKTEQNALGTQLIYPYDLLSREDHPGLCVMFELNKINYTKDSSYSTRFEQNKGGVLKSRNNAGVENTEVAMQRKGDAMAATSVRSNIPGYTKTGLSIIMPPPQQWIENLNVSWGTTEFGEIARDVELWKSLASGDGSGAASQMAAMAPKMLAKFANDKTGGKYKGLTDGARKYVEMMSGMQQNEFSEVLFNSVMNRMFPFQFNITPRNEKEANIVQAIIHRFKWASQPDILAYESENSAYFQAPYTFDISFVDTKTGNQSRFWTKFGTCALTNISVNRTPGGDFTVTRNSSGEVIPQTVSLDLQFFEMTKLNKAASEDPNDAY